MNSIFGRLLNLLARDGAGYTAALDGFLDSLLQKFENCRPGLTDAMLQNEASGVEKFFADFYEKETPRLRETIRLEEAHLSREVREDYFARVDSLIRSVVLPAYARLAVRYSREERNDFYLAPEPWHGLERAAWSVAGMAIGGLVVLAPFIPLNAKEWILPFTLGGLVFPNVRRLLKIRRYESELNRLVGRADHEVGRVSLGYLNLGTSESTEDEPVSSTTANSVVADSDNERRRAAQAASHQPAGPGGL